VGKYCSKTKTMWGNIVTIHSVLKKKNYKAKSTKTILEKKRRKKIYKKKKKKSHVEKHCSNP
jgi:hypothetical protein